MKLWSIVKSIIPRLLSDYRNRYIQLFRWYSDYPKRNVLCRGIIIRTQKGNAQRDDFVRQFALMCSKQRFDVGTYYVYPVLPGGIGGIASITAGFGKILESYLTYLCRQDTDREIFRIIESPFPNWRYKQLKIAQQ